jgi:CelD/BcsL family acetyltransferase involved in cellulose biosynthesis
MPRITLSRPDPATLEPRWREMEARSGASFFQRWTWTGCLFEEQFTDPVLLEAHEGTTLVAVALFNRRRGVPTRLHLHESGVAARDSVFIEHNGVLLAEEADAAILPACLRALRGRLGLRAVALSGVDATHRAAAAATGGAIVGAQARQAPWIDFSAGPGSFLDGLSANTRQQLRRSARHYAARGALRVERAGTTAEAHAFLDALIELHQRTWTARGRPGAFADAFPRRFHHALIDRGHARGEIDLLRISAGAQDIGYLYNFVADGRVSAYQSGFDYATADGDSRLKPGLTCHHLAIEHYQANGARIYDFLAGADRYKISLANCETTLHWLRIEPYLSVAAAVELARRVRARRHTAA